MNATTSYDVQPIGSSRMKPWGRTRILRRPKNSTVCDHFQPYITAYRRPHDAQEIAMFSRKRRRPS